MATPSRRQHDPIPERPPPVKEMIRLLIDIEINTGFIADFTEEMLTRSSVTGLPTGFAWGDFPPPEDDLDKQNRIIGEREADARKVDHTLAWWVGHRDRLYYIVREWRAGIIAARQLIPSLDRFVNRPSDPPIDSWTAGLRAELGELGGVINSVSVGDLPRLEAATVTALRSMAVKIAARFEALKKIGPEAMPAQAPDPGGAPSRGSAEIAAARQSLARQFGDLRERLLRESKAVTDGGAAMNALRHCGAMAARTFAYAQHVGVGGFFAKLPDISPVEGPAPPDDLVRADLWFLSWQTVCHSVVATKDPRVPVNFGAARWKDHGGTADIRHWEVSFPPADAVPDWRRCLEDHAAMAGILRDELLDLSRGDTMPIESAPKTGSMGDAIEMLIDGLQKAESLRAQAERTMDHSVLPEAGLRFQWFISQVRPYVLAAYALDIDAAPLDEFTRTAHPSLIPGAIRVLRLLQAADLREVLNRRKENGDAPLAGSTNRPNSGAAGERDVSVQPRRRQRPCVEKAGLALEAAIAARDDLIPETGKPPSKLAWEWVRENVYGKGKCPIYETFCRYIREYYQDGSAQP